MENKFSSQDFPLIPPSAKQQHYQQLGINQTPNILTNGSHTKPPSQGHLTFPHNTATSFHPDNQTISMGCSLDVNPSVVSNMNYQGAPPAKRQRIADSAEILPSSLDPSPGYFPQHPPQHQTSFLPAIQQPENGPSCQDNVPHQPSSFRSVQQQGPSYSNADFHLSSTGASVHTNYAVGPHFASSSTSFSPTQQPLLSATSTNFVSLSPVSSSLNSYVNASMRQVGNTLRYQPAPNIIQPFSSQPLRSSLRSSSHHPQQLYSHPSHQHPPTFTHEQNPSTPLQTPIPPDQNPTGHSQPMLFRERFPVVDTRFTQQDQLIPASTLPPKPSSFPQNVNNSLTFTHPNTENVTTLRERFPFVSSQVARLSASNSRAEKELQKSSQNSSSQTQLKKYELERRELTGYSELTSLLNNDLTIINQLKTVSKDAGSAVQRGALLQRLYHQIDQLECALMLDEENQSILSLTDRFSEHEKNHVTNSFNSWFEFYDDLRKTRALKMKSPRFWQEIESKMPSKDANQNLLEFRIKTNGLPEQQQESLNGLTTSLLFKSENSSTLVEQQSVLLNDSLTSHNQYETLNIEQPSNTTVNPHDVQTESKHQCSSKRRWLRLFQFQNYIRTQIVIHHGLSPGLISSISDVPRSSVLPHLPPQLSITSRESRRTKLLGRLKTEAQVVLRDIDDRKRARSEFVKEVSDISFRN